MDTGMGCWEYGVCWCSFFSFLFFSFFCFFFVFAGVGCRFDADYLVGCTFTGTKAKCGGFPWYFPLPYCTVDSQILFVSSLFLLLVVSLLLHLLNQIESNRIELKNLPKGGKGLGGYRILSPDSFYLVGFLSPCFLPNLSSLASCLPLWFNSIRREDMSDTACISENSGVDRCLRQGKEGIRNDGSEVSGRRGTRRGKRRRRVGCLGLGLFVYY